MTTNTTTKLQELTEATLVLLINEKVILRDSSGNQMVGTLRRDGDTKEEWVYFMKTDKRLCSFYPKDVVRLVLNEETPRITIDKVDMSLTPELEALIGSEVIVQMVYASGIMTITGTLNFCWHTGTYSVPSYGNEAGFNSCDVKEIRPTKRYGGPERSMLMLRTAD